VTPIVLGIVLGILGFVRAFRAVNPFAAPAPTSLSSRFAAGLPTGIFAAWLSAFVDSYRAGIVWFDARQLLVAVAAFVVVEAIALVVGRWRAGLSLLNGIAIGVTVGALLGAFSAIALGGRVGAAVGVTVWLVAWIALVGIEMKAFFEEFDSEKMKKRFVPQQTIDMTKETIEWARERMPLSRKS
jgi:hypothetical protein